MQQIEFYTVSKMIKSKLIILKPGLLVNNAKAPNNCANVH